MLIQSGVSQIVISQIVNCFALAFNMAGTYILFFRSFPQPSFDAEIYLSLEDATPLNDGLTVAEHKQKNREEQERYSRVSKTGLAVLFIGFALQAVATFI